MVNDRQDFMKYGTSYARRERVLRMADAFIEKHVVRYCTDTLEFYIYRDGCYIPFNDKQMKQMLINEFPFLPNNTRNKLYENLQILTNCTISDFNQKSWFNFKNGVYDLETGKLIPHSKDIMTTMQIDCNYDEKAECPRWHRFLKECFSDKSSIKNLQEFAGYCLTRDTKYEKALFMVGRGANGKGVFTETLMNAIGRENFSTASLEALSDESRRSVIVNKLVNLDTEVSKRAEAFESAFKAIVSGEPVNINEKYTKRFSYTPYCKLIFSSNKLPRIDDSSDGFFRRMLIIDFKESFKGREDFTLKKYLKDNEIPGVFNWAVEGLKRLEENKKFTPNEFSSFHVSTLKADSNPIIDFINQMIVEDKDKYIVKDDLYNTYKTWCNDNNNKPFSKNKFGREFAEITCCRESVLRFCSKINRVWEGIRVKTELDDDFEMMIAPQNNPSEAPSFNAPQNNPSEAPSLNAPQNNPSEAINNQNSQEEIDWE